MCVVLIILHRSFIGLCIQNFQLESSKKSKFFDILPYHIPIFLFFSHRDNSIVVYSTNGPIIYCLSTIVQIGRVASDYYCMEKVKWTNIRLCYMAQQEQQHPSNSSSHANVLLSRDNSPSQTTKTPNANVDMLVVDYYDNKVNLLSFFYFLQSLPLF